MGQTGKNGWLAMLQTPKHDSRFGKFLFDITEERLTVNNVSMLIDEQH
jgi:hypothetical protein